MKWFSNHKKQSAWILAILVLAGILVASFLSIGSDTWLGRAVETALHAVQKPFSAAGEEANGFFRRIAQGKELEAENEALKAKVAELEEALRDARLSKKKLLELSELEAFLNDNEIAEYARVTTRVTALDRSNWYSLVTIGAGTRDGVSKDDIVVSKDGLVGRVTSVGTDWASVLCTIHDAQNVSFCLSSNTDLVGIASGDGAGMLSGYMLDADASVKTGDLLLTSGMGMYPKGIPIGTLKTSRCDEDSRIVYVTAEPVVDFARLGTVTVLKVGETEKEANESE